MKKLAINLAICVGVCAVLGAVCLMGACSHEGTDDDVATFAEGITNTLAYDGSFTFEATQSGGFSYSSSSDKDGIDSTVGTKVTYNADSGALVIKTTASDVDDDSYQYFVKDDDGNLSQYSQYGDTKTSVLIPLTSTYRSYSTVSGCVASVTSSGLATASSDGTIDDVKDYMLISAGFSSSFADDSTLKVSGSTFTLEYYYSADSGSESITITYKFGSNGITEISYSVDENLGDSSASLSYSTSFTLKISYSYTSSMMPKNFNDFT